LNINNANALSTGLLELSAVTGTAYGSSIINNTSGGALTFSGLSGVKWSGSIASNNTTGIQFGTSASTSANNMDFGTGLVTAGTDRAMNIAGTGVTISMGTLTTSGIAASYDFQIDGAGNTLDLDGWRISGAATPTQAAQHKIKGSANVNIGAIENGTGSFVNGVGFNSSGVIRLTGNNTYTGDTEFVGSGTNIISGNNSAAVGSVKIAGGTGTGKKPVVRLDSANAISSSSSLLGASSIEQVGTLQIGVASDVVLNSFGTATIEGNNMIFINSSSTQRSLTFTNANNYITLSSGTAGSKKLDNQSANLNVRFNGNIDIGSSTNNAVTFTGAGNFRVDGAVTNGSSTGVRGLTKTGAGTLTLAGAGNNYNGATTVDVGTLLLTNSATLTGSTALTVSTSNTVSSSSSTRTAAATLNVASGSSLLSGSTTTVYSGGNLIMNGTAGAAVVETNGWVGGSGTFSGAVTLKSGSFLNPGNSPGTLNANSAIVLGNSTYNWQISNSGVGTTAGTDWDLLNVTTLLNMSAITGTGTDKWNLVVTADGAFTGWTNNNSPYEYIFAQAANLSLASGFSTLAGTDVTSLFNITTSGITSLPNASFNPNGDFKVMVGTGTDANGGSITTLSLMAVPEPSTGSMLGLGFAGLVVTRLLRRKIS
jgi:autotransporter-associated beta strand protein